MTGSSVALTGRSITELVRTAKALHAKAEQSAAKAEQFYISLGLTLAELKERKPSGITWPVFVAKHFSFGKSRANELIQIASGTTTVEKVREVRRESRVKAKAKRPLASGHHAASSSASEPTIVGPETSPSARAPTKLRPAKLVALTEKQVNRQVQKLTYGLQDMLDEYIDRISDLRDANKVTENDAHILATYLFDAGDKLMEFAQKLEGR